MKIYAKSIRTGEEEEVSRNLYWFEENYVPTFGSPGYEGWTFRFVIEPGDDVSHDVPLAGGSVKVDEE